MRMEFPSSGKGLWYDLVNHNAMIGAKYGYTIEKERSRYAHFEKRT